MPDHYKKHSLPVDRILTRRPRGYIRRNEKPPYGYERFSPEEGDVIELIHSTDSNSKEVMILRIAHDGVARIQINVPAEQFRELVNEVVSF